VHYLEQKYPIEFVPLREFCAAHPDLLPEPRARKYIANLTSQHSLVQRIFRKRFGRWHVHVPSYVAYMNDEQSIIPEYGSDAA